jgi:hypothetical protein
VEERGNFLIWDSILAFGRTGKRYEILIKNINIYLPVFSNGCRTWARTAREERSVKVFVNRVLGTKFVPKRDEMEEGRKKLHNKELNDSYYSPEIIIMIMSRRMRSQWPRGLRYELSSLAWTLRSWVRIPCVHSVFVRRKGRLTSTSL